MITINKYKPVFEKLDNALYNFLLKCMNCGTVFIVTNAMAKWVYKSQNYYINHTNYWETK